MQWCEMIFLVCIFEGLFYVGMFGIMILIIGKAFDNKGDDK